MLLARSNPLHHEEIAHLHLRQVQVSQQTLAMTYKMIYQLCLVAGE